MNYDQWKTSPPAEGRILRVTINVVVCVDIGRDPDADLDAEAEKAAQSIRFDGVNVFEWEEATVKEREVLGEKPVNPWDNAEEP